MHAILIGAATISLSLIILALKRRFTPPEVTPIDGATLSRILLREGRKGDTDYVS